MEFISTKNKRLARALICREAEQRDWARNPYIGLSRELNRRIRHHFAGANNRFVQRVWGYQWGQYSPLSIWRNRDISLSRSGMKSIGPSSGSDAGCFQREPSEKPFATSWTRLKRIRRR